MSNFPKSILKEIRTEWFKLNRVERAELCDKLQVTRPYFLRVIGGDAPMSKRLALKLMFLGLMRGDDNIDLVRKWTWEDK